MSSQIAQLTMIAPSLVDRIRGVDGIVGVTLGGSRARGTHHDASDFDLGLYYQGDIDVQGLQRVIDEFTSSVATATTRGEWGPWVDGGAWLDIGGAAVDLIYRDIDRVRDVWVDCQAGRYSNEAQTGHPLGFWSHAYAGELALGIVVDAVSGLTDLRAQMSEYPAALGEALRSHIWEAGFSVGNARKAIHSGDASYVAGSLFRACGVLAQSLHGMNHRWLINEKGAIAACADLPIAPAGIADRISAAFTALGASADSLRSACDAVQLLVDEVAAL